MKADGNYPQLNAKWDKLILHHVSETNRVFEIWSRSVVELRSVRRFVFLRSAAEATN